MAQRRRTAPSEQPPAATSEWDRTCLRVLVWVSSLSGADSARRVSESALCATPWAGIGPRRTHEFHAALKVLHQQGWIARWSGAVSITPHGLCRLAPKSR
jgi:hypothetical protein